ncbi:hypothetical protein KP509_02G074000 [Ceratopteris richardii]|uniref:lysozyme n=2 Tax=Ceratopteris richardii TaxID=49495 RepID=A0A8T2VAC5_CERRI|nr:hypothetical protein KP509_02G074000 [Ceratopteris richardii]
MGYQLPGLGNVSFPGFGGLAKHPTADTGRAKKGKCQRSRDIPCSTSTPSSPSSSSPSVPPRPSCDGFLQKGFLERWRQELRPLLNSIRFVEASSRKTSYDGVSRIGPFQISRQYHQDAWEHSPPIVWSRCRDLNHAENTVIAYWFKYCPEALQRRDFETLATTHKDGVQSMQKEDASSYWNKISHHLKQQKAASKKEITSWNFFSSDKNAKQNASTKLNRKPGPVLSSISTNTMAALSSNSPSINKQQHPLIQTFRPKVFRRTLPMEDKKSSKSVPEPGFPLTQTKPCSMVNEGSNANRRTGTNKSIHQTGFCRLKRDSKSSTFRHAFNMEVCQFSRAERENNAATFVQAIWRMHRAQKYYMQLRDAAILIQKSWRKHCHDRSVCQQWMNVKELIHSSSDSSEGIPSVIETQETQLNSGRSHYKLLYNTDISPKQEDALLTELVSLLNLGSLSPSESCCSFRFPQSFEETTEACTPKMKPDLLDHLSCSLKRIHSSSGKGEEDSYYPSPLKDENVPFTMEASISPLMEKEIMTELAKLSSPSEEYFQEDSYSAVHCLADNDLLLEPIESQMSCNFVKDGIIRKLTYSTTEGREDTMSSKNKDCEQDDVLDRQVEVCIPDYSICGSTQHKKRDIAEEEYLDDISIPLLVDQSPVLISKRRVKYQNPCSRKINKALVCSLSEWQHASGDRCKALEDQQVDPCIMVQFHLGDTESAASKEFTSVRKASNVIEIPSEDQRLIERIVEGNSCWDSFFLDDSNTGQLLETRDVKNSMIYGKAVFQCLSTREEYKQDILLDKYVMQIDASATSNNTNLDSLQRLCILWDKLNIDLLVRSLKFQDLHRRYLKEFDYAKMKDTVQLEIDELEAIPGKPEEESRRRELVLHQRHLIYTSIASSCNGQARQHMYEQWRINENLSGGRLEMIVYELLWIDPLRYQESAELVIKYL